MNVELGQAERLLLVWQALGIGGLESRGSRDASHNAFDFC